MIRLLVPTGLQKDKMYVQLGPQATCSFTNIKPVHTATKYSALQPQDESRINGTTV